MRGRDPPVLSRAEWGLQLGSCRKWSIGKFRPKLAKALMMVSSAYELASSSRLHLFDRALDFGTANPLRCDFRGKLSMAARITLGYSSLRTDSKQTGNDSTLFVTARKSSARAPQRPSTGIKCREAKICVYDNEQSRQLGAGEGNRTLVCLLRPQCSSGSALRANNLPSPGVTRIRESV
jgi:hypothetical protein